MLGLSGCSTAASATNDQQTNYVALNGVGVVTVYAEGHRKLAPTVSGTDLAGQPLALSQFAGKVVVLNFWASWCPPCRSEAAALEQVYTDTRASGVQFVGVDIRENGVSDGVHFETTSSHRLSELLRPVIAHRARFPQHRVSRHRRRRIILDRQGRIAARGLGEMTYTQLLTVVKQIAAQAST